MLVVSYSRRMRERSGTKLFVPTSCGGRIRSSRSLCDDSNGGFFQIFLNGSLYATYECTTGCIPVTGIRCKGNFLLHSVRMIYPSVDQLTSPWASLTRSLRHASFWTQAFGRQSTWRSSIPPWVPTAHKDWYRSYRVSTNFWKAVNMDSTLYSHEQLSHNKSDIRDVYETLEGRMQWAVEYE